MRTKTVWAALAAAALLLTACGGGGSPASGPGTLKLLVTDGPFPFDYVASAEVTIDSIDAHEVTGDAWSEIWTGPMTLNLVELSGGVAAILGEVEIDPGSYDMFRLIVSGGSVTLTEDAVTDGGELVFSVENGNMDFPSGAQTGIKVKLDEPLEVVSQLSADLMFDFDLEKNFTFNGPPDHAPGVKRVLFTPVVRAVLTSTTGTLTVLVNSDSGTPEVGDDVPLEGATVRVLDDMAAEVTTQMTGADGVAAIALPPGTYDLEIEALGHVGASVIGQVVVLANVTDAGVVTLEKILTQNLTGTVTSSADGTPLEGVSVTVTDASAAVVGMDATDASGLYAISLPSGTYDVTFDDGLGNTAVVNGVTIVGTEPPSDYVLDATLP